MIVELKCCESLGKEHQAQLFILRGVEILRFERAKASGFNDRKRVNIIILTRFRSLNPEAFARSKRKISTPRSITI